MATSQLKMTGVLQRCRYDDRKALGEREKNCNMEKNNIMPISRVDFEGSQHDELMLIIIHKVF